MTAALRRIGSFLPLVLALLVLSAVPADAKPLIDEERYYGPSVTRHFAGLTVSGSVPR